MNWFLREIEDKFRTHLGRRFLLLNAALFILLKVILPLGGADIYDITGQISSSVNSREIITETNLVRQSNGLAPLSVNVLLDNAAAEKLNDMLKNNYFDHVSPAGVSPWFWITRAGYKYSIAGENLALGFYTAKDTVSAWMGSDSHKANLLHPKYTEIGVASANANVGGIDGVLVVQMFGVPSGSPITINYTPVPTPTPVKTASPTPALPAKITPEPTPVVAALQTKAPLPTVVITPEPVPAVVSVSTDSLVPPVTKPIFQPVDPVTLNEGVNFIYSVYLSLIILASFILLILRSSARRTMVFGMGAHALLLIFTVLVPALKISTERIIF